MKKDILIDGYNLMHRIPEIRSGMKNDLEGARERLILRLSSYAALHRARLTVVFDG
ncbi:MAG TPA: NYN domain-containing protein, partial [bacterium]|nr:NYN domain-containing protein [bacterium]